MSIANELSCDVAAAMFTRKEEEEQPSSQRELAEVLLVVHSTLRHLTAESRRANGRALKSSEPPNRPGESAASGSR